jgi:hypothetical protein
MMIYSTWLDAARVLLDKAGDQIPSDIRTELEAVFALPLETVLERIPFGPDQLRSLNELLREHSLPPFRPSIL